MSNNKQTSQIWLSSQLFELFEQYIDGNYDRQRLQDLMIKTTEQAKAMHKEGTIKLYNELESLGFFEWLDKTHNLKDTDINSEYLDKLPLNAIHRTVANSMVFRFFREKYELYRLVMPKVTPSNNLVYYVYQGRLKKDWNGCFNTYEEAELACLRKLIEIAKEKNNKK